MSRDEASRPCQACHLRQQQQLSYIDTLHPPPCTLHPAPHTLHHPQFYTLHATRYTLHPIPYTLHPNTLPGLSSTWPHDANSFLHAEFMFRRQTTPPTPRPKISVTPTASCVPHSCSDARQKLKPLDPKGLDASSFLHVTFMFRRQTKPPTPRPQISVNPTPYIDASSFLHAAFRFRRQTTPPTPGPQTSVNPTPSISRWHLNLNTTPVASCMPHSCLDARHKPQPLHPKVQ